MTRDADRVFESLAKGLAKMSSMEAEKPS